MSLRIKFRFDGRCGLHPRYNPENDGRPSHKECAGCESLFVIHLYTTIARRRADRGDGLIVSRHESSVQTNQPVDGIPEEVPSSTETAEP